MTMAADEVHARLEAMGTSQNRKVYGRHGVGAEMYGVSFANLGKLKKKIKTDQALAEELWASGNHDARVLATMIADPAALKSRQLDTWARDLDSYDNLVRALGLLGRQMLADRLAASAVGLAGDDAVRAMGEAWRSTVRDHPGLYAATDRFPCAGDRELEAAVDRIVGILGQGLVSYDLSADATVHAGRALRSAFHGFSHLEAGDGHPHDLDLDDSFDHLIELVCAGIRALS